MADTKITGLTALTTPAAADLIAVVDDVVGTPTTKKVALSDLLTSYIEANISIQEANISDLGTYLTDIVSDTTPQLGGNLDINGASITGSAGTITADDPIFDVSETWNNGAVSFTAFAMDVTDTASAAASLLANWSVDTVSVFAVGKDSKIYLNNGLSTIFDNSGALELATTAGGISLNPGGTANVTIGNFVFDADQTVGAGQDNYVLTYDNGTGLISLEAAAGGGGSVSVFGTPADNQIAVWTDASTIEGTSGLTYDGTTFIASGAVRASGDLNFNNSSSIGFAYNSNHVEVRNFGAFFAVQNNGPVRVRASGSYEWSSSTAVAASGDLKLFRDAANTLALLNSTNAQTFNIYNTYTDASNYERLEIGWGSNIMDIGPEAAGTGVVRPMRFGMYGEKVNAIGSIGGGTQDIDLRLGNVVTGTVDTSTTTFTFSNPIATGSAHSFTLILTNGGSQTVNWPASVDWAGGTGPTLTAAGVDVITFTTVDGGTTWYGFPAGINMS